MESGDMNSNNKERRSCGEPSSTSSMSSEVVSSHAMPAPAPTTSQTVMVVGDNQFGPYRDCDTRSLASSKRTNVTKSSSSSSSKQTLFKNDDEDEDNEGESSEEDEIDVELYERYNRTRLPTKTAAARSANRHMDMASSSSSSSSSDEETLPHELPTKNHRRHILQQATAAAANNTSTNPTVSGGPTTNSSSDATMNDESTTNNNNNNTATYSNMALYPNMMRRNRSASMSRQQQHQQQSQNSQQSSSSSTTTPNSSSLLFLSINTTTSQTASTTTEATTAETSPPAHNLRSSTSSGVSTNTNTNSSASYSSILHTLPSSSNFSSLLHETTSQSSSSSLNTTKPFEPKSGMFAQMLEQAEQQIVSTKSSPLTVSLSSVEKLAYLYSNYESYHSLMMLPVSVHFKDCAPSTHQQQQHEHNHIKRQRHDSTFYSTPNSSQDLSSSSTIASEMKTRVKQVINTIFNSDCECNVDDEDSDEDIEEPQKDGQIRDDEDNDEYNYHQVDDKLLESVVPSPKTTTTTKKEFHLCPLCGHCLYEPITLVCGCTYCRPCLHEHQQMLRQVYEKRRRELDREQEEQIRSRLVLMRNSGGALKRKHSVSNVTTRRRPTTSLLSEAGSLVANVVTNSSRSAALIYNDTEDEEEEETDEEQRVLDKRAAALEESLNQCYHCSRVHEQNCNLDYTRPNVLVAKLVDKFWSANIESRRLRNDIRAYIASVLRARCCHTNTTKSTVMLDEKHELAKFESLLLGAYHLDPSNHLLLADLFILSFFLSNTTMAADKYVQMACDLRPDWSFAHYMKMIIHLKTNDINQVKMCLDKCIRLEPTCNQQLKLKLYQLITSSKSESSQMHDNNKSIIDSEQEKKSSSLNDDTNKYVVVDSHLVKPVDLECSLCYRLLYSPVTTPCGHSFCMSCLERSLDHYDRCPLCKHSLADHLAERRRFKTHFLDSLIQTYYAVEYGERKRQYVEELKDLQSSENEIPIFVCTLALPFAPVPLHVYEPRYKLMLRRCIENETRCFGMCMYTELTPQRYTEYGCMLEIRNHQFTRDGRAILSTFGSKRFKVATSSMRDGYNIAQVEWIKDVRVETETEKNELQHLHDEVYRLAHTWYSYIPSLQKARIYDIYGFSELPEPESDIQSADNGPFWHWFFLNILPLDENLKYKFLNKTSLMVRLAQLKKIILILLAPYMNMLNNNSNNNNNQNSSNSSGGGTSMPTSPSLSSNRTVPNNPSSNSGDGGSSNNSSSSSGGGGGNSSNQQSTMMSSPISSSSSMR